MQVNYQAGFVWLRIIVLGSGISSVFRVILYNLLKCIKFVVSFPSSCAGIERIFSLSKQAEIYI